MNLSNKGSDYRCNISGISKNETKNFKHWLQRKKWNTIKHKNLLS